MALRGDYFVLYFGRGCRGGLIAMEWKVYFFSIAAGTAGRFTADFPVWGIMASMNDLNWIIIIVH